MNITRPTSGQLLPKNAKLVFKGIVFDVYQWEQPAYNGSTKIFEKISRADTVLVIPITTDGKIIVSRSEQPGKKSYLATLGGRVERGEDPLVAAQRELLEESGYKSDDWSLFEAVQPYNKIEWAIYTFVAKNCVKITEQDLDGAEKIELLFLDFDQFIEMTLSEDFLDVNLKIKALEAKLDLIKMSQLRKQFSSR